MTIVVLNIGGDFLTEISTDVKVDRICIRLSKIINTEFVSTLKTIGPKRPIPGTMAFRQLDHIRITLRPFIHLVSGYAFCLCDQSRCSLQHLLIPSFLVEVEVATHLRGYR